MSYKSVLTVWDGKKSSMKAFQKSIDIARRSQGHLHVLCPAFMTVKSGMGYPYTMFPEALNGAEREQVAKKAEKRQAEAQELLSKEGILYTVETAILNRDELPTLMGHAARFSDLTVLPRPYGDERTETDERIAEGALFSDQCPILIVPEDQVDVAGHKVVIAWDGSQQALRAAKGALPLLEEADEVDVLIVSNKDNGDQHSRIAADIGTFLSRHRINVDIKVVPKSGDRMSDIIRSNAQEMGANLVVMGGYGHSPLREFLFGGATRNMMKDSHIPILMAH
ncbi:MAG: universal stress protein [Rhodobacteraceae bacterium]|nr:universal stress protein [Paracoccaceae bacterium]